MEVLQIVLVGLFTLTVLVVIHEFGHYWVARRCGVAVLRFSVGFGRPLWRWLSPSGTEFVVAPVLLGGYVKMYGESFSEEGSVPEEVGGLRPEQAFSRKGLPARAAIVAAGPAINLLFAVFLYWLLFLSGSPVARAIVENVAPGSVAERAGVMARDQIVSVDGRPVASQRDVVLRLVDLLGRSGDVELGLRRSADGPVRRARFSGEVLRGDFGAESSPLDELGIRLRSAHLLRLGTVSASGAGARSGLRRGDHLLSVDGRSLSHWADWVEVVRAHPGRALEVTLARDGVLQTLPVTPERRAKDGEAYGFLGVSADLSAYDPEVVYIRDYGVFSAAAAALSRVWDMCSLTLRAIGKMITGALSPKQLSGPISIVQLTGQAAEAGWKSFFELMALISLSLGVLNLLPIPVLDGGHLLFLGAEAVRRRPLSERTLAVCNYLGLFVIGSLMVMVITNDILRLL